MLCGVKIWVYRGLLIALTAIAFEAAQPLFASPTQDNSNSHGLMASFTLKAYSPGELTQNCQARLQAAKKLGFQAVSISPSFAFDPESSTLLAASLTIQKGEIEECLNHAWTAGFNIVYQPHLDSYALLKYQDNQSWRGTFAVTPDAVYESVLFDEFKAWLDSKKKDILAAPRRHIDAMLSAELDHSLTQKSGAWAAFLVRTRTFLRALGLESHVRLSFNVNWGPREEPSSCRTYAKLIQSADFIGVSLYGDFSHIELGPRLFTQRLKEFRRDLGRGAPGQKCRFDTSQIPISIAEFGLGGILKRAEANVRAPASESEHFNADRLKLYQNLFTWAAQAEPPLYLNFWTIGVFDAFGLSSLQVQDQAGDPEIKRLLRRYNSQAYSH